MKYGRLCPKHPELQGRRHNGGNCPACKKISRDKYVAKNREKIRQSQRDARLRNLESARAKDAAWRTANPDKVRENNRRRTGFTAETFNLALEIQKHKCAICEVDLKELPTKKVHADHCHATGRPRGVLCHYCNAGLGSFRDDPERLKRAIQYLEDPTLWLIQ